jgi:hypothetical protein
MKLPQQRAEVCLAMAITCWMIGLGDLQMMWFYVGFLLQSCSCPMAYVFPVQGLLVKSVLSFGEVATTYWASAQLQAADHGGPT